MENENTITYNNQEYKIDELSEKAQYFVTQLRKLTTDIQETRLILDRHEIAYKAFTDLLGEELEAPTKTASEEAEFVAE